MAASISRENGCRRTRGSVLRRESRRRLTRESVPLVFLGLRAALDSPAQRSFGSETSKCKTPETGGRLLCLRDRKGATVVKYFEGGRDADTRWRRGPQSQIMLRGHVNALELSPCLKGRRWGGFSVGG